MTIYPLTTANTMPPPPSPAADRAAWLRARRTGIGGSDVAAILGHSDYRTAYDVWMDKTGQTGEIEPTPAMERGTALEPVAIAKYEQRHGVTVERLGLVRHPDHPFLVGTPDGVDIKNRRLIEVKVPNRYVFKSWNGVLPVDYFEQMQHYMFLTGLDYGVAVILVDGLDYHEIHVTADKDFHRQYVPALHEWWIRHMVALEPVPQPEPYVKPDETLDALDATTEIERLTAEYGQLRDQAAQIEARQDEIKDAIKLFMGAATTLAAYGKPIATYNEVTTRRVTGLPADIKEQYTVATTTRQLRIK